MRATSRIGLLGAVLLAGGMLWQTGADAQAAGDDIAGVVRSAGGGEAGVWVIAETDDLETTFRKIVVTGDDGRFLVPELPDADYEVWVRGYGLVDSGKQAARPGDELALEVTAAATPQEAARIYPANYWYSLLEVPAESEFPGTGAEGNGISERMRHQAEWVDRLKDGCQLCHQMGNLATREMPMLNLDDFDSTLDAWEHRVQVGRSGPSMSAGLNRMGRDRALGLFADWTDRIAAGEVPPAPPRPQGQERNLVLTMWGWGDTMAMVHDEIATDKRNPYLYPNSPVYGVGGAGLTITDPVTHRSVRMDMTTRVPMPERGDSYAGTTALIPSPYWGTEQPTTRGYSAHNPMLDAQGRLWITQLIRPPENADWCRDGSDHPSAKNFPISRSQRQLSYYDTESGEFVHIDTCYMTHHLQFAEDENDTLWLSGSTDVVGWLNTKLYDETGDEQAAQGWCPTIVDTNGDGVIGEYTEPGEPQDPAKDMRLDGFAYGIIPNPVDGSIWIARRLPVPGSIVRLDLGDSPPETCSAEVYEPPFENPDVDPSQWGHGGRGIDVDRNGVLWTALGGSGHLASFDRSRCAVRNGPTATGQHCPEGWTLYPTPGPQMKGVTAAGSADFHYYNWVDQFDTLGLGANVPIANGTSSDALLALLPDTGEWVTLRVPYPLGFYTRGLDGRIDDREAGWKGRGVWASYDSVTNWHNEGGKGMTSEIVRFQIRPHPLAE